MQIRNVRLQIGLKGPGTWLDVVAARVADLASSGAYPLRLAIVYLSDEGAVVEATVVRFDSDERALAPRLEEIELIGPQRKTRSLSPLVVVQVVPTGIRCEFGGYAGDACPATNLLAAAADFVVTHPNAVNASELNEMAGNVLYVEGKSLDDFLLGRLGLARTTANRVGTFIDPTGLAYLDDVENTLNAARSVAGIDCGLHTILRREIGVRIEWTEAGCAVGTIQHPESLLEAVEKLIQEGADAVGGVSVIHGVTSEMFHKHLDGLIPNPSGGVEAIITHLISRIFRVPTAHAPLPYYQDVKERDVRNPRASAEFISTPHYFCVLKGLSKAPALVPLADLDSAPPQALTVNNVGAVVMPASCLGGIPALAAELSGIPVIAVRENETILDVTNAKMRFENVIEVESYLEASGVLLALKQGISLESLRRPMGRGHRIVVDSMKTALSDLDAAERVAIHEQGA